MRWYYLVLSKKLIKELRYLNFNSNTIANLILSGKKMKEIFVSMFSIVNVKNHPNIENWS